MSKDEEWVLNPIEKLEQEIRLANMNERRRASFERKSPFDDFPLAGPPKRTAYIVWNDSRTEGYVTFDQQVAYEARKGAESNCFDENGTQMKLAQAFCEIYSGTENATTQTILIGEL